MTIAILFYGCGITIAASPPAAIANLEIDSGSAPAVTTLAFISEEMLAIGRYTVSRDSSDGTIIMVALRGGNLQFSQSKNFPLGRAGGVGELFAASHGGILSKLKFGGPAQLFSGDLKQATDIPIKIVVPPEHQANMVAEYEGFNSWKLYRLGSPPSIVRAGAGEVLSVSDDFIVLRGDQNIRVEKITGGSEGSFQVPPRSVCYGKATILAKNRLLLTGCKQQDRVVDFQGKELVQLPPRDGWDSRIGQSLDGNRVLFDTFTRRIPLSQRVFESVEELLSFGMLPVVESTGEEIRVIETKTGRICFELDSPNRRFGTPGDYHADISPSGRYVAVVVGAALSVYQLPNACTIQ